MLTWVVVKEPRRARSSPLKKGSASLREANFAGKTGITKPDRTFFNRRVRKRSPEPPSGSGCGAWKSHELMIWRDLSLHLTPVRCGARRSSTHLEGGTARGVSRPQRGRVLQPRVDRAAVYPG
ncbi:MAG: hypothetical protein FLDDKLPJ_01660 [Phycisphaerae bacterium]|nr:hypothetical protein [Phycisphaerae bacterium]